VIPVVDPLAQALDEFPGGDRRRGAEHRDQIALALDLDPQYTETGFLVVKRGPFDRAGEARPSTRGLNSGYFPNTCFNGSFYNSK
jgi:hypothetical protein